MASLQTPDHCGSEELKGEIVSAIKLSASHVKYKSTSHVLQLPPTFSDIDKPYPDRSPSLSITPTRQDITLPNGKEAFILYDLLSPEECKHFMEQGLGIGMTSVQEEGYPVSMRVVDKVIVYNEEVADILFSRTLPFLKNPYHAKWIPAGINPTFRICKYEKGGHFQPHQDGGFRATSRYQSKLTFMIYLNKDFTGGHTTFFDSKQPCYSPPESEHVVHTFVPKTGSCLIFDSDVVHDGGQVSVGEKFIMRSEVMFADVSSENSEGNFGSSDY
jgi:prolyl 4-hydroxylase